MKLPKQKAPARVGSDKGRVDLDFTVLRKPTQDSASDQADNLRSSTTDDKELGRQLDAEVCFTRIGSDMIGGNVGTIGEVISVISSDQFRTPISELRRILNECGNDNKNADFKAAKLNLDAVVIAGKIDGKIAGAWERGDFKPSGFLQIDMDDIAKPEKVREELREVDYILSAFLSPSGDGVKAIACIGISQDAGDFKARFEAVAADMLNRGYTIDKSCSNYNRLMFASWDTEAWTRTTPAVELKMPKAKPAAAKPASEPTKPAACEDASQDLVKLVKLVKKKSSRAKDLYEKGNWEFHKFTSQSEADYSLACSICEVTSQHAQQVALFRDSALYRNEWKLERGLNAARKAVAKDAERRARFSGWDEQPEQPESAENATKDLAAFLVSHRDTLGMSWKEIDALRPPFVIDHFIRQGELLLLGAESKSRKSWLAQDAAFCVAGGLPWLADEEGKNGFTTARAAVHVVDLELNPSEMRFRFAKARSNRFADNPKGAEEVTERVHSYSLDGMNVTDIMPMIGALKATVRRGDLVIVDCLYRLVPDGNEVAPLSAMLETLKRFAGETQCAIILVDHFRKAGDEKARNRFAGSFVKQASASTLVAIEVIADDVLVLNIDARTFHGCPKVHARFNLDTYAFNRLPEIEVAMAKANRTQAVAEGWILQLWKDHPEEAPIGAADAAVRWEVRRQTATPRLGKLVSRGWLTEKKHGHGKATTWQLTPDGLEIIKSRTQAP